MAIRHGMLGILFALISASGVSCAFADHLVAGEYERSADGTEIVVRFKDERIDETYYFNNNPLPLCFSFKLNGPWYLTPERGFVESDTKNVVGALLYTDHEIDGDRSLPILERISRFIESEFEKRHFGQHLDTLVKSDFVYTKRNVTKLAGTWIKRSGNIKYVFHVTKYFFAVESRIFAIFTIFSRPEQDNSLAIEMLNSFNTRSNRDCYLPFLREHVPMVDW